MKKVFLLNYHIPDAITSARIAIQIVRTSPASRGSQYAATNYLKGLFILMLLSYICLFSKMIVIP